jgi:hypothetical protein
MPMRRRAISSSYWFSVKVSNLRSRVQSAVSYQLDEPRSFKRARMRRHAWASLSTRGFRS